MNRDNMRRLDEYRLNQAGPLENDLIDEFADGRDGSSGLYQARVRPGAVGGVDRSALEAFDTPLAFGAPARAKAGGRLRVGIIATADEGHSSRTRFSTRVV